MIAVETIIMCIIMKGKHNKGFWGGIRMQSLIAEAGHSLI